SVSLVSQGRGANRCSAVPCSWVVKFLCVASVSLCLCGSSAFAQRLAAKAPPKRITTTSPWDVEAREYLGTPESEAAVNRGLAYLAARQQPDGHWSSGGYRGDVAITGLCLMAFLASGHQPGRGKYGLVLNEAVDFLANS